MDEILNKLDIEILIKSQLSVFPYSEKGLVFDEVEMPHKNLYSSLVVNM